MKSKIVVDSAANLYQMEGIDFACAPIKVVTEEQEYPDDGRLDAVQVAETLRSYKGRSSTSCPNVGDWLAAYQGADQVFAITITGTLSGSYNAALLAAQDYQQENPEAKVYVLDSLSAGPELQLLAERLRALFDAGTPFEEICVQMEEYKQHTHLLFSLESLNNLARNGRVSPAVAAVGTASLSGELEVLVKTRGEHGALERIVLEMKARGFVDGPVRILHCSNPAAATRLKNMITTVFEGAEVQIMPCGVLCSYYAELGGLMIGFEDSTAPAL